VSEAVSKAVLVTGCSTGIGRATAERLARRGWTVYASARRPESITDLADAGCKLITLDVADEASRRAAIAEVEGAEGAVGALVNNAGFSLGGPVEEVALDEWRRQFETNLFGMIHLTQLALPAMRRQRWGRIANVSSIGGRLTFPGAGAYHASKHAVEAMSDALRYEVKPFGVRVSVIEPGLIARSCGEGDRACAPAPVPAPAVPGHGRRPHVARHSGDDNRPGLGSRGANIVPAAEARTRIGRITRRVDPLAIPAAAR
jgi:NAD(P)-dependent dehydrogenase (short-subunit alcohol dehydrogenase family)